jgi:adenylyltransferase/sulfurtransferase
LAHDAGGLDDARLLRYSRHILLDEFGVEAQQRLLDSHALIVGVGGLGNPAALYLATAGVQRLTLVDGDQVDGTNLQRQILFTGSDIGRSKVAAAAEELKSRNPDLDITALDQRVDAATLEDLVKAADVVLDCSDNFRTRHAINRCCVMHRKPLVSGAAIRFDGQLAVFDLEHDNAPCYACLFPDIEANDDDHCATMGVLAPLTGTIGSLQAAEAIKCLTGIGDSLARRLLMVDALAARFETVAFSRDPGCAVCGNPVRAAAKPC